MAGCVGPIEALATGNRFFRGDKGHGEIRMSGDRTAVKAGDATVAAAGMRPNLINTGKRRLRLFALYAPPRHAGRLVEATKALADKQIADLASVGSHGKDCK